MSQNSEKEFENLFKRAADQYPINSNNADWAAVLRGLEEKKREGFFWLNKKTITLIVLLLTVGMVSSLITGLIVWQSSSKQKNIQNDISKKNNTQQNAATEKKIAAAVYEKVMLDLKKNQPQLTSSKKQTTVVIPGSVSEKTKNNFTLKKASTPLPVANSLIQKAELKNDAKIILSVPVDEKKSETAKNKDASPISANSIIDSSKEVVAQKETNTETKGKELNVAATKNNTPIHIRNNSKYFYLGVLYSKDKSSIQLESNKGIGYSWAFTLGYHFSKKWSVETGLHIEKKELYTTGGNFDKTILGASGKILWIESEKKLLEIPITLKRDLIQKNRHSVFGTVGLSSYIVNKETVEYEEEVGGVIQNESVVFNNNTSNIFSTLNLSLGYQYKLGKIGNIRIEPYFNLPIGVIGKSKTPIISKGIYVGWTFDLHKKLLKQ